MKNSLLLAATCVALSGFANAAIMPIPSFVGDRSEPFTSPPHPTGVFPPCLTARVFSSSGDLCTFDAGGAPVNGAHVTSGWGFSCTIFGNMTPSLYGSASGRARYTFDMPVDRFGGFFGSNAAGPPTATVEFRDAGGALIGTAPATIPAGCGWAWSGWESTTPIARVDVIGSSFGGAFIMMDDMQIRFATTAPPSAVPAASTTTLALLVALLGVGFWLVIPRISAA